jgi:predicted Zn-dependent protease
LRLAQAHLASGQPAEALREAQAAVALAPKTIEAAVVWAQARGASLASSQTDSAEKVLKLVDDILKAMPSEHRVIPLRISLLVQTGKRDDAIKAFEAVLAQKEPLSQATLLQLEQLSRALGLGLEQQCAQQSESLYGQTPEITLAQSLQLANRDKSDEGLRLIEDRQQAIAPAGALDWQSVRARYLDATRDPRARAEWTALADQYPQNAQVQRQALKSPAIQANKEVADRLIERLRGLGGDQGVAWRLERARWLLRHTNDTKVDLPKATAILEKIVADAPAKLEARLLLANGLERLGYSSRAITELESVVRQRPQASAISLELARLDQKVKNFDAARAQLERVLNDTTASAAMRARAAAMLADQGNDDLAIAALEKAAGEATRDDPDRDVLLARLYWRRNEMDEVEALCPKIKATPTEDGVRVLALYYASQDRTDDAEKVLALLDGLDLPPGSRETVRADYYSQFGTRKQAVDAFLAATEAAPQDPITWYRLIIAHILLGEGDLAAATAADALKALPDDAAILLFQKYAEQVKTLAGNRKLRSVLAALVRGQRERTVAAQAIDIIAATQAKGEPLITISRQIRRLADRSPDFLPIQDLLTSIYLDAAKFDSVQNDAAIRVATRAMSTFPDAVEPAWLASVALARGNRWQEALKAAQEWRRRAAAKPIQADLMIAEAKTRLGNTQEALQQLRPYVKRAAANPDQYPAVLTSMTQTLIAAGKIGKAADTLIALLDKSPRWRQAWMQLAVLAINDPQTSAEWLKTVGTKIPANAASEQLELSRYWHALSLRSNNAEYRKTAQEILDNMVKDPEMAAEAWLAKGLIAVSDNDSQLVERSYREALKINANLHAALNNLAMIEFEQGGDLAEALALAKCAVAEDPTVPNYYDTLAQIQAGMKDYDAAIAAIDKAISRQSAQPQWKVRKEQILRKAGRHDEADQLKRKLDAEFPGRVR